MRELLAALAVGALLLGGLAGTGCGPKDKTAVTPNTGTPPAPGTVESKGNANQNKAPGITKD